MPTLKGKKEFFGTSMAVGSSYFRTPGFPPVFRAQAVENLPM